MAIRSIIFADAILEYYNWNYYGIKLWRAPATKIFSFNEWDRLCRSISKDLFLEEIIIQANDCFRFWFEPSYVTSGQFIKKIIV